MAALNGKDRKTSNQSQVEINGGWSVVRTEKQCEIDGQKGADNLICQPGCSKDAGQRPCQVSKCNR